MKNKQVTIIGAGPAGIATALQLKRYNITPLILEQDEVGGLLRNAHLVENYPGFPDGISGVELVGLFKRQLENAGLKVNMERALELEYEGKKFHILTDRRTITCDITVIATGTKPKESKTPAIPEHIQDRVFYEVHPIINIRNKTIAVIGSGDSAFDYALNLSKHNKIIVLGRNKQVKCLPVLGEKVVKCDSITIFSNVTIKELIAQQSRIAIAVADKESGDNFQIIADLVIFAIGRRPNLDFLGRGLRVYFDELIASRSLYLIGDVANENYRQTAISVGQGVKTAMQISEIWKVGG